MFLLSRDQERGEAAAARLRGKHPGARVEVVLCDLTHLGQVDAAAARILGELSGGAAGPAGARLDLLALNAGAFLPAGPKALLTSDGIEVQHAANFYGHLLLCMRLLSTIIATPGRPRIVWTASEAEKLGKKACRQRVQHRQPRTGRTLAHYPHPPLLN